MDEKKQPGVQFTQIFLSDAHLQHRADALQLPPNTPVTPQPIAISFKIFGPATEGVAAIAVRIESKEDPSALYQFQIEITGIVQSIPGEENLPPREYVTRMGTAALFPFVREALANLTMRGRFGPVWLKPYNFAAAQVDEVQVNEPPASRDQLPKYPFQRLELGARGKPRAVRKK